MLIKRSGSCHGASRFVLLSFAWLVGRRLPASFGVGRKPMRLCPGKFRQSVDESRPFGQEGVDLSLGRADAASKPINFTLVAIPRGTTHSKWGNRATSSTVGHRCESRSNPARLGLARVPWHEICPVYAQTLRGCNQLSQPNLRGVEKPFDFQPRLKKVASQSCNALTTQEDYTRPICES